MEEEEGEAAEKDDFPSTKTNGQRRRKKFLMLLSGSGCLWRRGGG